MRSLLNNVGILKLKKIFVNNGIARNVYIGCACLFSLLAVVFCCNAFAVAGFYDDNLEQTNNINNEWNDGTLSVTGRVEGNVSAVSGDVVFEDQITLTNLTEDQLISFNSVNIVMNEGFENVDVKNWTVKNNDNELLFVGDKTTSYVPNFELDCGVSKTFNVSTTLSGTDAGALVNTTPFDFSYDYLVWNTKALITPENVLKLYYDGVDHSDEAKSDEANGKLYWENLPTNATAGSNWPWHEYRMELISGVSIDSSLSKYHGWKSFCGMFMNLYKAQSINGCEYLNTENVTNMESCFIAFAYDIVSFNQVPNVSNWNTSKVTSFAYLFNTYGYNSQNLNLVPDVNSWDTSKMSRMEQIFDSYARNSTNISIVPAVKNWKVNSVKNFSRIFANYGKTSTILNIAPDVSTWDTSDATSLNGAFYSYASSSLSLDKVPDVSEWNTNNVIDMSSIFDTYGASSLTLGNVPEVGGWNTEKVTSFKGMFQLYGRNSLIINAVPNVSNWNTSMCKKLSYMFYMYAFSSPIINVVPDVSNWDTTNCETLNSTFRRCMCKSTGLDKVVDVSNWNTSNVTNFAYCFGDYMVDDEEGHNVPRCFGSYSLKIQEWIPVQNWDVSKGEDFTCFMEGFGGSEYTGYKNIQSNLNISNWKISDKCMSLAFCFANCLVGNFNYELDFSGFNTANLAWPTEKSCIFFGADQKNLTKITLGDKWNIPVSRIPLKNVKWYNEDTMEEYTIDTIPLNKKATYIREDMIKTKGLIDNDNILRLYYDKVDHSDEAKSDEANGKLYWENLPTNATAGSNWPWHEYRMELISGVSIDSSLSKYHGWKSFCGMFMNLFKAESIYGCEYLNTENVTAIASCFQSFAHDVNDFNQVPNVPNWNTSKVTNMDSLFYGYGYNSQNLKLVPDVSNWDTSNVKYFAYVFREYGFSSETLENVPDVSKWNTQAGTKMGYLFYGYAYSSKNMNTVPDVSSWVTENVTSILAMFKYYGQSSLILSAVPEVDSWSTSKVTAMNSCFAYYGYSSNVLNAVPNVENWDTGLCSDVNSAFSNYAYSSPVFNQVPNVSNWNTANVTTMNALFYSYGYSSQNLNLVPDVSNWATSNVANINNIFSYYGNNSSALNCVPDVSKWNTSNVTTMNASFNHYGYITNNLNVWPPVEDWNTNSVTDMSKLFQGYARAVTGTVPFVDLNNWDTSKCLKMEGMFADCFRHAKLTKPLSIANWDVSKVQSMKSMFWCGVRSIDGEPVDVSKWNTHNLQNAEQMFAYQQNAVKFPSVENWDTSSLINVSGMFHHYGFNMTSNQLKIDLSKWNINKITNFSFMFGTGSSGVPASYQEKNWAIREINLNGWKPRADAIFGGENDTEEELWKGMFSYLPNVKIICDQDWSYITGFSHGMFAGDTSLPHYDSSIVDKTYAYPDNGNSGYFEAASLNVARESGFEVVEGGKLGQDLKSDPVVIKENDGGKEQVSETLVVDQGGVEEDCGKESVVVSGCSSLSGVDGATGGVSAMAIAGLAFGAFRRRLRGRHVRV